MKNFLKKLEKLAAKIGYKYVRYGIPFRWQCKKHQKDIDFIKSLLADNLSIEVFDAAIQWRKTRNESYITSFYDVSNEKEVIFPSGERVRFDSSQYFVKDIVPLSEEEVFVDGGGFIGDTALIFIEQTCGKFKKIHIFEPMSENIERIQCNMIQYNNIILHKAGLYSANKDMYFERSGASSRLAKTHNKELVKLVSLDEYLSEQERSEITYIKLDIEGAELAALKGMKKTIADFKPKLAICIYHKAEDLWELPLFIHELNPDYKLYIRHHWKNFTETVLYAIP